MERPFITLPFEYNGIIYDTFREEHVEQGIENLVNEFALRETMNKAVNLTSAEFRPFAEAICTIAAEKGLSVSIVDSKTNKLIAPFLLGDIEDDFTQYVDILKLYPVFNLLESLHEKAHSEKKDIFEARKIFSINILSVPEQYAGRGVSFTGWFAALVKALSNDYHIVTACPTDGGGKSGSTCTDKMKFKRICEIRYEDFEYKGEKVFSSVSDAEYCFFAYRTLHSQSELWDILGDKTINIL